MRIGLTVITMLVLSALAGCSPARNTSPPPPPPPPEAAAPAPRPVPATMAPPPAPGPAPATAAPPPQPARLPSDYPTFPLPAPRPSAKIDLPVTLLGAQVATVGAAEQALRLELARRGYDDRSYYAVPGGFALATRAERFLPDGRSAQPPRRWAMAPSALIDWAQLRNPRQWVEAFRRADPGRYRVLVFLVTTQDRTTGGAAVNIKTAEAWTEGGADRLPRAIAGLPLTPDHHVEVLVYEFARAAVNADPAFVRNSSLGARGHLHGAGLVGG